MKDEVDAFHGLRDEGNIIQIASDKFYSWQVASEIGAIARDQRIEHAHSITAREQRANEMRTDESATTGHEDCCHDQKMLA